MNDKELKARVSEVEVVLRRTHMQMRDQDYIKGVVVDLVDAIDLLEEDLDRLRAAMGNKVPTTDE